MDNKNKYEDQVDTFFDDVDKKKEKLEKVKRIIKFVMRLIFPFFLFPLMMLFGGVFSLMLPKNNIGVIGVAVALVFLLFFPLYSFIYGMFIARSEKRNYFFAIYNSSVSTMQFCILDGFDLHAIKFYVCVFFSILFWTLVSVRIYNYRPESEKSTESANDTQEKR